MDKLNGNYNEYYESGKIKKTEFWKDGLLEGSSITFSENAANGLFVNKISYRAGKRHGKCQWFNEKGIHPGQLECEANYENGEQHGLTTRWYDNGRVSSKAIYRNGQLDGIYRQWDSKGKNVSFQKWKLDKCLNQKNWDENGNKTNVNELKYPPPLPVDLTYPD